MAGAVTAVTGRREKAGFAKIGETLVAAACSGRRLRRAAGGPRPLREGGWRRTRMTNRREEADAMRAGWRRGRQPASRGERRCVLRLSLSPFDAWSGTEFATATLPYFLLGFFASPTNGHQRVERPVRGTVLSTGAPWLRRSGNRTGLDPVAKQMPEYSASPARRLALVSSLLQSLDLDYMDNHHNHALASAVDALAALIALCPLPSSCELEALALFDARVLAPFLSALRAQSKTTAAIQPLVVHGFKVGCIPQSQHSPQLLRVKNWLIESLPDTHEHDDDPDEHRVLFVLDLLAALLTQLATHIQRDNDPDPNVSHTLRDIINLCINVALPLHPVHSGKPSRCQKRVVSTILPQLFDLPSNLVDHEELIQWLWTRIEALSGDPVVAGQHQDYPPLDEFAIQKDTSKSSAYVESVIRTIHLRNITTILVHLFNHFFGVIVTPAQSTAAAAVTARSSLHPKKQHHAGTGIPKKYRRQDAKDGIITGGNNNAPPHGDRDDALDWRGQTLPQPSNALPTLDLRGRALFWRIVQHALVSGDALAAKFALFLLKRVVDYSARVAVSGADSGAVQGGLSFSLGSGAGVDALRSLWDEYFVVLDIMQESGVHLIEPLVPKFRLFLNDRLHASWWIVLMHRGLQNNSAPFRKRVLEYVLALDSTLLQALVVEAEGQEFMYEVLLPHLDNAFLFSVSGLGAYASPFGERVCMFVTRLLGLDKAALARVVAVAVRCATRVACIYMMMGVAGFAGGAASCGVSGGEVGALRAVEGMRLVDLMESERSVSVWTKPDARKLFSRLAIQTITRLSPISSYTFSQVLNIVRTLGSRDESYPETRASLTAWLHSHPSGLSWLQGSLKAHVANFLKTPSSMAVDQSQAFEMATLVRYLSPEAANFALQPASTLCKTLHSSAIYEAPGTAARTVFLLAHLDLAFAFVLSPAAVQDVISIVLDFTEHPTEMALVETGLTLLGKLAHSREVLCVSYVQMEDILLRLWKGSIVRLQAVEYSQLDLFTSLSTLAFCSETAESIESTCLSSHDEYQTAHALALLLDDAVYSRARRSGSGGVSDLTNAIESCKYACLVSLARGLPLASPLVESLLALCAEAARNTSNQVAPLVFAAVRGCLCGLGPPHGVGGLSDSAARSVVALLEGGLQVVLENVGNAKSFVALLREYCGMVFCPTVLASEAGGEGAALRDAVMRSFAALTSLADQKIAIMSFVADPCFEFWRLAVDPASSLRDVALESLHNYLDMFMSLALFGPLRDKNMDAERLDAAVSYAVNIPIVKQSWKQEELYDTQGTAEVNFNCHDYTIRVKGADLLLKLDSTSSPHSEFARCLLEKLLALHNSNKLKAKFDATLEHRMQMRLWCIVHVILDLVIASGTSLVAVLLQAVDVDLLPSTRHYVEWAVIRAILATREFPDVVWSWLDKYELRSTSIVSVMSVLHNVGRFLESPRLFFDTLFVKLLPWLTSNHFTIRLHAQFVAFQAWTRCQSDSSLQPLLENHKALVSMMQFVATNIDCIKHRLQAKNLYFVGGEFNPTADLTVDFVFRGGLMLAGVTEEERISAWAFLRTSVKGRTRLPLFHDEVRRKKWSRYFQEMSPTMNLSGEGYRDTETEVETSLQRKIEPWEMMLQSDFDFSQLRDASERRARFPLIVVASWISKAPNLGGLCRTCEIFNAELLVVANLRVREDPAFLVTAVTSEKWQPMMEVRDEIEAVKKFLLDKKQEGYSVCGIEQATNSVSLDTFVFPPKCVLLLGREKLGIPTPLIPLMDHLVEIPQFGVIRSLNVHVSGALVLYNFSKQQKAR